MAWSSLTVVTEPVSGGRCCGLLKGKARPARTILDDVSGVARPGEVLAIMGASGAGKSTLLNTLLFRNLAGLKVSGERRANSQVVSPTSLTAVSAYVQQDDLLIGTLTVREHLTFQALVRMDSHLPQEVKRGKVEEIIQEVTAVSLSNVLLPSC